MNAIVPQGAVPDASLSPEALLVRQALIDRGLETPMRAHGLSRDQQYHRLRESFAEIMATLGLDLGDDSLAETPHRIASMYLDEVFAGLDYSCFPRISTIANKMQVDEPVCVDRIALTSTCEHHFVTIDGFARVAYIPAAKVLGLSKINRIVQFFGQRPQVQERLTRQVMVALQALLETEDVAVRIEAQHYCVKARGIRDGQSLTRTLALGGRFRKDGLRREFIAPQAV